MRGSRGRYCLLHKHLYPAPKELNNKPASVLRRSILPQCRDCGNARCDGCTKSRYLRWLRCRCRSEYRKCGGCKRQHPFRAASVPTAYMCPNRDSRILGVLRFPAAAGEPTFQPSRGFPLLLSRANSKGRRSPGPKQAATVSTWPLQVVLVGGLLFSYCRYF